MKRVLTAVVVLLGVAVVLDYVFWYGPLRDPHPGWRRPHGTLTISGAKVYVSPDLPPLDHATVVVKDGLIAAVGRDVQVPADARTIPCDGCVVTAGYWNAHVHFTEPKWDGAAWKSRDSLNAYLVDMLTSRGFTTVVDASSDLRITLSLRRRIARRELLGPNIYTAGSGLYPPNGIPYYIRDELPFYVLWMIPQPRTPEEATGIERRNIERGADLLKLFTGSYIAHGKILSMPVDIARAAVEVAHEHG
ncbi:MAG: hypothetical protein H0X25_21175 [Acidobacteriales bacterium]|nr:hypothetical protein [Terriglobales bacterium]